MGVVNTINQTILIDFYVLVLPFTKGELEGVETSDTSSALTPPGLPLVRGGVKQDTVNVGYGVSHLFGVLTVR